MKTAAFEAAVLFGAVNCCSPALLNALEMAVWLKLEFFDGISVAAYIRNIEIAAFAENIDNLFVLDGQVRAAHRIPLLRIFLVIYAHHDDVIHWG
jgi:hypothetical protein